MFELCENEVNLGINRGEIGLKRLKAEILSDEPLVTLTVSFCFIGIDLLDIQLFE